MTNKLTIAVAGATGYTAGELLRILLNHPHVGEITLLSTTSVGQRADEVHRDLLGDTELVFTDQVGTPDVVFLCLGHGLSREFMDKNELPNHCKVIDLGNDFRLDAEYNGCEFVYGLSDTYNEQIKKAQFLANPGCFATAIQLALVPLATEGLLTDEVHVSAITGSTGAGKRPSETTHFSYRTDNISIYKNFTHQHLGEISRTLGDLQGGDSPQINFVPHRGDFARGIFASIYTKWDGTAEQAQALFQNYYKDSPFVRISAGDISLKEVVNTNKALLHVELHNGYIHIASAIDNLLKGASGQAVENMNLMFGFEHTAGLRLKANAF